MAKKNQPKGYEWSYCSFGGVVRVNIRNGEDIAHLGELDKKLWTVLSCPTTGLEFPTETLKMVDTDGDGKIRVDEVVAAADWLCKVLKDKDLLVKGLDTLKLDQINTESEAGAKLYKSALQILSNLKLEKDEISVADSSDSVAIFAATGANGDGVITEVSAEDEHLKEVIRTIVEKIGSATDRSGAQGVTADHIEAFYTALADYAEWQKAGTADIFPFGDNTQAALDSANALKEKVADYFMRCKLIAFTELAAPAVDVSADRISAISDHNLTAEADEIASYPIARPSKEGIIRFDAVNPAWKARFDALRALVFEGKESVNEEEWNAMLAKFAPYTAWKDAKKGESVESLGLEAVQALLKADDKAALLELVAADKALEEEANSIDEVNKLMHLYRDFYKLLKNYVILSDFYSPDQTQMAVFEAGKLYIDQRCCRLCVRVEDMGKHADMAGLSGMFLLYCACVSKTTGKSMNIVAVMTDGSTRNLRPGTNGVFYDRDGLDYDATIVRVVENPLSIKQAFWAPYVKFWNWVTGLVNKSAAEKDAKAMESLQAGAEAAPADAAAKKAPFDIAKFAGIFAAIGMAVALLGGVLAAIVAGIAKLPWWGILLIIVGIMLLISGPSCFIAWGKLRRRNLGPVLNANGWAVNSNVIVNIPFGRTLTSIAKYPKLKLEDPYKPKTPLWWKILRIVLLLAVIAFGVLFFTDNLKCIGLPFHKEKPAEELVEEAAEAAPEAEIPLEEAAAE
ncbi:MAG: phage holin family protein [Bacteroidales bacterium]|nr:phage holin family protein [Bacteroidales bacterium]